MLERKPSNTFFCVRHLYRGVIFLTLILPFSLAACFNAERVHTKNTKTSVKVGLLVPYGSETPSDKIIAENLENAARLAIADLSDVTIDLRVYPTAADPEQAAQAAKQAVEENADIILGPFYAENANAAAQAIRSSDVNLLAFSNNTDIAGGNLFLLGQNFRDTSTQLVNFAATQNRRSYFILNAKNPSGILGKRAIEAALEDSSAELAGTLSYVFSHQGIVEAIPVAAEDITITAADTIFLTAGVSGDLPFIAQLLPEKGIAPPDYQYIGLTRWDIAPQLFKLKGLNEGWFAMPDPDIYQKFIARYQDEFDTYPHTVAGLAYDGIAAIGALAQKHRRAKRFNTKAITQSAGFIGVNGVFRFLDDGTNQRQLAIATIRNGEITILRNATHSFSPTQKSQIVQNLNRENDFQADQIN